MFPYPSGAGLHVGHPEGYTATDILGRYKKMNGHNVLHPMGWDAFGLPAEQYAIKTGQHPRITTEQNIDNFRRQLKSLGFGYDWDREVNTTDPNYVRWTQWIFLQLYNSYFNEETQKAAPVSELEAQGWSREQIDDVRLAFVHEAPVNWSPSMGTVLANEEIEEWKAKGETVERRPLRQWMLRITKYADRLINELEPLDWPESIKLLQKNWIGKSTGAEVHFDIEGHQVTVFTTRPDTLFGATYMVLAPEHPLVRDITTSAQKEPVDSYIASCASKSDLERGDLNKDKSGVPTGATATNPVNGEQIPVWIADYVMMSYGTGAIMAVPAHDERDFEFANKFAIPVTHQAVPESELPVLQPEMDDFKPTGSPEGPLAKATDWISYSESSKRETNTMPQWAGSCWYYMRYCDPDNTDRFISKEAEEYWAGTTDGSSAAGMVDLYVGGTEHAVLHLLYARFWHKVLHDLGHVSTIEPFQKLVNQGLILGEDGAKMSKSLGNVVNPDDVVSEYGADALRLYEMFMGPLEQVKPWQMKGVEGVSRFLAKVWRLAFEQNQEGQWVLSSKLSDEQASTETHKDLLKVLHETIKKVSEDIERLSFNTAISQMMICTNTFGKAEQLPASLMRDLLKCLNPFAPHITEEINSQLPMANSDTMLCNQDWPEYNEAYLVEDEVEIVVQVNGKLRGKIIVAKDASKDEIEALAQQDENVIQHTEGKTIRKIIVVPGRLVNIVAN